MANFSLSAQGTNVRACGAFRACGASRLLLAIVVVILAKSDPDPRRHPRTSGAVGGDFVCRSFSSARPNSSSDGVLNCVIAAMNPRNRLSKCGS
jgi:hypothetical protein